MKFKPEEYAKLIDDYRQVEASAAGLLLRKRWLVIASALRIASRATATLKEIQEVFDAIADGYPGHISDSLIVVDNPDATPERLALAGVNPCLVLDPKAILKHLSED